MESYNDLTYLWGATVRVSTPVPGVEEGPYSFVTWEPLTSASEAEVFQSFWRWFNGLRERTLSAGHTFAAYCFWAQAEDSAIDRALASLGPEAIELEQVKAFRSSTPPQWIDMHDVAKRSIQTDGPLGLKHLARAAGFTWRDEHPSGEASMGWYEVAISDTAEAAASRERLLHYNEDDCRATAALRDWLNGPAKNLPHRNDRGIFPPSH
jgi:predicted RecB family nuclease